MSNFAVKLQKVPKLKLLYPQVFSIPNFGHGNISLLSSSFFQATHNLLLSRRLMHLFMNDFAVKLQLAPKLHESVFSSNPQPQCVQENQNGYQELSSFNFGHVFHPWTTSPYEILCTTSYCRTCRQSTSNNYTQRSIEYLSFSRFQTPPQLLCAGTHHPRRKAEICNECGDCSWQRERWERPRGVMRPHSRLLDEADTNSLGIWMSRIIVLRNQQSPISELILLITTWCNPWLISVYIRNERSRHTNRRWCCVGRHT